MATPRKSAVRFRERSELLDFLLEVSAATSETLDLDRLLANVADIVKKVIECELFAILLYNERSQDLRIRFVRVRGQFEVEVSSPHLLHRWEDLSSALENAELSEGASLTAVVSTRRLRSYSSYTDVERLLRSQRLSLKRYCDNC